MDYLERLIDFYNSNEEISVEDILSRVLKNDPVLLDMPRKERVELKRQFLDYIQR